MPRIYTSEFRRKVLDLLATGRKVADLAVELKISDQTIYNWRRQHLIDSGQAPGITSSDHVELVAARKPIGELEVELAATRRANELLKEVVPPKGRFEIVATMVSEGFPIQVSCRVLDVAESSYYGWRSRTPSTRSLRHTWASENAPDNGLMESFWGRMQTELLDRQRWRTRLELANAMFDYLEIFHNRQRRHSSIGMLTPNEYEKLHHAKPVA